MKQLLHGNRPIVKNMGLDRRQAVGGCTDAAALDVVGVVARTAVVIIPAFFYAVMDDHRQKRGRTVFGVHPFDIIVYPNFQIDHIFQLPGKGLVQFVKGLKGRWLAGGDGDGLAGQLVNPVIQGNLQDLRDIEIAGEDIGLLAEGTGLDAAAGPALPGVFDALADPHLLHDHRVGVENRGVTIALADNLGSSLQKAVRGLAADMDARLRLQEMQLVGNLKADIGYLAYRVGAGAVQAAEIDLGEIVVGAAFLGGNPDFRWSGMVVDLDPQAADQFLGLFPVKDCRRPDPFRKRAAGAGRGDRGSWHPSHSIR